MRVKDSEDEGFGDRASGPIDVGGPSRPAVTPGCLWGRSILHSEIAW